MPDSNTNPYLRPASGLETQDTSRHHSRRFILLTNVALWILLLAVPVSLNVFAFVYPIPVFVKLYWSFNYWAFLPIYFLAFACVNLFLFRDSTVGTHLRIQILTALVASFAQIPFLFIMLATYRGPW